MTRCHKYKRQGSLLHCSGCKVDHPATSEFFPTTCYVRKDGTRTLSNRCRNCRVTAEQQRYLANYHRLTKYGLTPEAFLEILDKQGGVCRICQLTPNKRGLFIDHDHETGNVRGLLCNACNLMLGFANDSPERLLAAVAYLQQTEAQVVS